MSYSHFTHRYLGRIHSKARPSDGAEWITVKQARSPSSDHRVLLGQMNGSWPFKGISVVRG